jgi:hypothetical protein
LLTIYNSASSFASASDTPSSVSSAVAPEQPITQTKATSSETVLESTETPTATPESEVEIREKAQKVVAHDLKTWQDKFA